MADPSTYRPRTGSIPTQPGVYRFRDKDGRVVYVGKAKSLRARLSSYFQDVANLHARTATMVTTAASVEWTVVATEVEALQLEYSWIKEFDPRFNVKYRDDKSYPWLAITMNEEFPRVMVGRGAKKKGVKYYGPYSHAWAIRDTVDTLLRVFPMRSCSNGVFKRSGQIGRPCLLGYIDKCSAPCVGRVDAEEHRRIAEDFADFMGGRTDAFVKRIQREMYAASEAQDYEKAARLRDDLGALHKALEKQAVVFGDGTDADVIALAEDPLEVAVQIFHVRAGRIRGQRGWVADRVEDLDTGGLVGEFLLQLYAGEEGDAIPREILVPAMPEDADTFEQLLSESRGSRVSIRVPQRGDKRSLQETVAQNASQSLALHKTKRASDLTVRSQALEEIQEALDLPSAPLRIECYDISNLQGTEVVASMVVFEDGLARKSEYRRFVIRGVDGQNDVASMHEVIIAPVPAAARRADRRPGPQRGRGRPRGPPARCSSTPRPGVRGSSPTPPAWSWSTADRRRSRRPSAPSTSSASTTCRCAAWPSGSRRCGCPDQADPVILPRSSEGLYLLQRIRDEAHRFAITHHRSRRSKTMVESLLDDVPGLGEVRRKTLIKHFGSLKKLRAATIDEIAQVPGIGTRTATAIAEAVATQPRPTSVNTATGEIQEH